MFLAPHIYPSSHSATYISARFKSSDILISLSTHEFQIPPPLRDIYSLANDRMVCVPVESRIENPTLGLYFSYVESTVFLIFPIKIVSPADPNSYLMPCTTITLIHSTQFVSRPSNPPIKYHDAYTQIRKFV
jgi:hypothetical protein